MAKGCVVLLSDVTNEELIVGVNIGYIHFTSVGQSCHTEISDVYKQSITSAKDLKAPDPKPVGWRRC